MLGSALRRSPPAFAYALVGAVTSRAALHTLLAAGSEAPLRAAPLFASSATWWLCAALVVVRPRPLRRGRDITGGGLFVLAVVSIAAVHPSASGRPATVVASSALSLAALLLALASLSRLGRCFGVLPDARGLVTGGPYRLVRHPLYLAEVGALTGIVVAAPSPRNVVCVAGLAAAQTGRAALEEKVLRMTFPGYAEYAARTPMLVPLRMFVSPAGRAAASQRT